MVSYTPRIHFSNPYACKCFRDVLHMSYKCIGARDRILDHCFCLSSAATTPFSLVPIGSPALCIRTHALSSNLTTLPSGLCHFFAVRTTTAWRTSPRLTLFAALMETVFASGPKLRCFLTTTTMRSPGCGQVLLRDAVSQGFSYQLGPGASIATR
jgi:hypothetical protein